MVQQVLGASREKRHTEGPDVNTAAMGATSATALGPQLNPSRAGNRGEGGQHEPQLPTTLLPGPRQWAMKLASDGCLFFQTTGYTFGNRGGLPGDVRKCKGTSG
jgi:hypothetical protein